MGKIVERSDIGFSYDSNICYRIGSVSAYFEVLLYRQKRFYWPRKSEVSRGFHNGYEIESFFRSGYFYTCVIVSTLIIATINGILLAEMNEVRLSLGLSSFSAIRGQRILQTNLRNRVATCIASKSIAFALWNLATSSWPWIRGVIPGHNAEVVNRVSYIRRWRLHKSWYLSLACDEKFRRNKERKKEKQRKNFYGISLARYFRNITRSTITSNDFINT